MRQPNEATGQKTYPGADYTDEETEWLRTVERWKKVNRVRFPSAVDLLRLAKAMGYRKPT